MTPENCKKLTVNAEDDLRFFSNSGKKDRERWVFDRWRQITNMPSLAPIEGEGPDFVFAGESVEIVEVLRPNRLRHKEYKADVKDLKQGQLPNPHDGADLQDVIQNASCWVSDAVLTKANHYGSVAQQWILVVYANYSWCDRTEWARIRADVTDGTKTFKRIDILTADGTRVEQIKP